jgi:hypothetical protein
MLNSALQLQCRCSEIADITSAYVLVSARYLRPSINQMEGLAQLSGNAYDLKKHEFEEWLQSCLEEIPRLVEQTDVNLSPNMRRSVESLQRHLIESADMRDA